MVYSNGGGEEDKQKESFNRTFDVVPIDQFDNLPETIATVMERVFELSFKEEIEIALYFESCF